MSSLPAPLPVLAAAGAAGGYALGRLLTRGSAGGAATPATAAPAGAAPSGTSSDLFGSFGQAGLNFGDASSPAGALNGVLPVGSSQTPTPDWTGLADLIAAGQANQQQASSSSGQGGSDALAAALVAALAGGQTGAAGAGGANPCLAQVNALQQRVAALNAAIGRLTPAWLKQHPNSVPLKAQYQSELAVATQQLAAAQAGQC